VTQLSKVLEDINQQQDVSFKVQIVVLAECSNRESLLHVGGVRVIALGYDVTRQ